MTTSTSPTQRTLTRLRELGFTAAVVERWNPYARIRQDLFGFVDLVAVHPDLGYTLYIQTCAGGSHAAREAKIRESEHFPAVAACGIVEVWSWAKQGPRGKRKTWNLRTERVMP